MAIHMHNVCKLIHRLSLSGELAPVINYRKCIHSYSSDHYDIVIAGGGMIGTTLACTLGKNKKLSHTRILLLEAGKQIKWEPQETYSNRVSALNPNTFALLNKIGVWKHIEAVRYAPVKQMQVWDALSDSMIQFNKSDLVETIAYIVENNLLLDAVGKEIKNLENVTIINQAKIKDYHLPTEHDHLNSVISEDGNTYRGHLLLGCDGINSQVRHQMGVKYISWDYNQRAIVATVKLSEETENVVAWQRFLPTGPIALLPLTSQLSSLVWSTTTEEAKRLLEMTDEHFIDALNDAFWKVFTQNSFVTEATKSFNSLLETCLSRSNAVRQLPPSITGIVTGSRAAFPLGFGHATNYVTRGVALVGDAAHRVHPLAGQGVNLGFGDIITLNEVLGDAVYSGSHIKNSNYLRQYETERQRHNVPTMLAIDGLHKLYNTDFTPVVLLRSLGLQFTHALSPLKNAIIQHAAQ